VTEKSSKSDRHMNHVPEIIGQAFVYLTYVTLPVIYIWIRCHVRAKVRYSWTEKGFVDRHIKQPPRSLASSPSVLKIWFDGATT